MLPSCIATNIFAGINEKKTKWTLTLNAEQEFEEES